MGFPRRAKTTKQRQAQHIRLSVGSSDKTYRRIHGHSDHCHWPMPKGKRCEKTLGHSFGHSSRGYK